MVNRTGFSILRFRSQRRPQPDEEGEDTGVSYFDYEDDDTSSFKAIIQRQSRSKSWAPPKRKRSATPSRARTGSIVRQTPPPVPLPRSGQPSRPSSSSSSSLGSCDERGVSPNGKAGDEMLCSPEGARANSHPTTPKRPPRPRNALFSRSDKNPLARESPRPSISLFDSSPDLSERGPSYLDEPASLDNECPEVWSENVRQLIRETDEAFKAVGFALAEAKIASQSAEVLDAHTLPAAINRPTKPMPLNMGLLRDQRSRESLSLDPLTSPTRRSSVTKSKKKSKTPKKPRINTARQDKSQAKAAPRWALSGNVTEILTGQRFKRIEADEMLTPDQIEELRQMRERTRREENLLRPRLSDESDESARSLESDITETPVEPFHLEDLPSRIGAAGVKSTITPVEAAPPSIPADRDVIRRDFSSPNKASTEEGDSSGPARRDETLIAQPDAALPSPPPKSPARLQSRANKSQRQLPTIPEVMVTTPDETHLLPSTHGRSRDEFDLRPEETDDFFYLKSTPYTLTRPGFRHGPITFSKAEVGKASKTMDDTLDWTAFQMAILGGAGDLSPDTSAEEDAKQMEDIRTWFESFGFETYGQLITDEPSSPRDSAQSGLSSTPSTIDTEVDLPIPVGSEYPSGFWNVSSGGQSLDAVKFYSSTGLKRWTVEGRPKRYTAQSTDSLPPSPMMPLFINTDMDGDEMRERIPMGYNLGHDLGDFLKWEAEHVYAGGFYGSP